MFWDGVFTRGKHDVVESTQAKPVIREEVGGRREAEFICDGKERFVALGSGFERAFADFLRVDLLRGGRGWRWLRGRRGLRWLRRYAWPGGPSRLR